MPVSGIFAHAQGSMALPRRGDSRQGMLGARGRGKAPPCKGLGAQGDFSLPGRSQVSHVCCPGGGWHSAVWPSAALRLEGMQTLIHIYFFFFPGSFLTSTTKRDCVSQDKGCLTLNMLGFFCFFSCCWWDDRDGGINRKKKKGRKKETIQKKNKTRGNQKWV